MMLTAAGLLLLTQIPVDGSYLANVLPAMILTSLGMGAVFMPLTLVATTGLDNEDQGLASGLFNTSQQIGGALGLAVLSTIAAGRTAAARRGEQRGGARPRLPLGLRRRRGDRARRARRDAHAAAGQGRRPHRGGGERRKEPVFASAA